MAIGKNQTINYRVNNNATNQVNDYYQTVIGSTSASAVVVEKIVDISRGGLVVDPNSINPGVVINNDTGYNNK